MTQEDKELLLKDLGARIHCRVKFTFSGDSIYTMKGIDLIVTDEGDWEYAVTAKGIEPIEIEYIKPYLRPLSSMTEEEFKEYHSMLIDVDNSGLMNQGLITKIVDWLNEKMFDHRNLIPKGLALEAPAGMYKF